MGPRRAARSGLMALALLCCMVGTFSQSTQKFNITKMLAGQPRFSVLREMLSSLGVAAEINGRKSVTLLAPANNVMRAFRTNNNKTDAIKITDLLRFHVLLTYFDIAELRALKTTNYTSVTTLLQTTGRASGNNGFVNIYSLKSRVKLYQKFIQQRYGRQEYEEFDEAETTDVEQQALLPSVRYPKLWMVKCQIGHEREASIGLMQKFMDMDMQGKPLLIKSAIALDHLKGYLYVESEKEAYVRESIRGMRVIFQREVKLVPIKEMTDVLSVEKKSVDIDTWVRVKNGVYKGDLAKVVDVDHVRQRATIKLIPRVDLQALALKMNEGSIKGSKDDAKNRPRPAPRFINVQELQDLKISIERKRDPNHAGEYFEFFDGMQFKDGYLYKGVSLKSIDSNGVLGLELAHVDTSERARIL